MVIFAVKKKVFKELDDYVLFIKKNLNSSNFFKNPFIGGVVNKSGLWIINIKPLYPNVSLFGLLGFIVTFVITGFSLSWWLFPSFIIGCLGFFWSDIFFVLMFKLGLKMKGIQTKIYTSSEIIQKVFFSGTK